MSLGAGFIMPVAACLEISNCELVRRPVQQGGSADENPDLCFVHAEGSCWILKHLDYLPAASKLRELAAFNVFDAIALSTFSTNSSMSYHSYNVIGPLKVCQTCGQRKAFNPEPTRNKNEEAEKGEFPWLVSLKLSIYHFCSGSILNRWWILTTASCTNIIKNDETSVLVQAGLLNTQLDAPSFHVELVVTHQEYSEDQESHNLGLIMLHEPLYLSPLMSPICIFKDMNHGQQMKLNNCGPSILLKHSVTSLQNTPCTEYWPNFSEFIFCMRLNESNIHTCTGDIGAPLVCKDSNSLSWTQVGLLSDFDKTCVRPYIFTKVSHYLPWIKKSTQAAGKPFKVLGTNRTKSASAKRPKKKWVLEKSTDLYTTKEQLQIKIEPLNIPTPWQSLIVTCNNKICNGAILSKYWIVTTAACVEDVDPDDTAVYVGLNKLALVGDVIRADRIFPHRGHDESVSAGHNIALILLMGPILFWEHVRPLSMEYNQQLDISSMNTCGLAGLRWLESGKKPSSSNINLVDTQLAVKKSVACPEDEALLKNKAFCIEEISKDRQLFKVQEGSAILCMDKIDSNWTLVGILSKVLDESPLPAFATRLAAHISWMNNVSKEAGRPLKLPPPGLSQGLRQLQSSQAHSGLGLKPILLICFTVLLIVIGCYIMDRIKSRYSKALKARYKKATKRATTDIDTETDSSPRPKLDSDTSFSPSPKPAPSPSPSLSLSPSLTPTPTSSPKPKPGPSSTSISKAKPGPSSSSKAKPGPSSKAKPGPSSKAKPGPSSKAKPDPSSKAKPDPSSKPSPKPAPGDSTSPVPSLDPSPPDPSPKPSPDSSPKLSPKPSHHQKQSSPKPSPSKKQSHSSSPKTGHGQKQSSSPVPKPNQDSKPPKKSKEKPSGSPQKRK
ncbi:transmembrane protease serine 9-like [Microcaecilia unicolor]|uniref:Transmembrane protease serine 9-like n=1 Tax=Microcaecilia unicolor TaxID=1415580 RepID=A0A6P7XCP3_9AMPH|nr:transmembrane protease serine 9-like [Microcaecilia unicolor]